MSINIGDNNKITHSNIGSNQNDSHDDNSKNKSTTINKKFYQKEGFWAGVLTGVISTLISSGIIWGISELIKLI